MTQHVNRAEKEAALFNAKHSTGTLCRFWRGVKEGDGIISRTRCHAFALGGHTACVMFECGGGAIALTHVEPIKPVAVSNEGQSAAPQAGEGG